LYLILILNIYFLNIFKSIFSFSLFSNIFLLDDLNQANKKLQQIENNNNTDALTSSEIDKNNKRKRKPNKRFNQIISSSDEDEIIQSSNLIRPKKLPTLNDDLTTLNNISSSCMTSSKLIKSIENRDLSRVNSERSLYILYIISTFFIFKNICNESLMIDQHRNFFTLS